MKFKTWLAENKSEFIYPDNIHPTKLIGSGHFAHVYDTNVTGVVMRINLSSQKNKVPTLDLNSLINPAKNL
jgi:hypothetical protein